MLGARAASRQKRNSFTITCDTRIAGTSSSDQIQLPLINGGNYNFIVHWGDGTEDNITAYNQAEVTHTYPDSGIYELRIGGTIVRWQANNIDRNKWLDISNFGDLVINNTNAFNNNDSLDISAQDGPICSGISPEFCFENSNSLTKGPVRPTFVSITSLDRFLNGCTAWSGDVSNWDVSNIQDFVSLFQNCHNVIGVSGWDISSATTLQRMFQFVDGGFDEDLGNWDTSNVSSMSETFKDAAQFNNGGSSSISGWNTSNVTTMSSMFGTEATSGPTFNQPIENWDVGKVASFGGMFRGNDVFNQPLSGWNTSSATNMSQMFRDCNSFDQDIGTWDVSGVTNFELMFEQNASFNNGGSASISGWNTSRANNISDMFRNTNSFNQDIGYWDVSNVTSASQVFNNAFAFNNGGSPSISGWELTGITTFISFFNGAVSFNQPIGAWNTSNVTNMESVFAVGGNQMIFNQDLGNWDTSNVTTMRRMFYTQSASPGHSFNNGGSDSISGWDVSKVKDMEDMFQNCFNFDQPIGAWNTSSVTDINSMLRNCDQFDQDLSNWTVTGITNAGNFMLLSNGLSTTNYDLTLSGWAQQSGDLQSGVSIHFGSSKYSIATGEQYKEILSGAGWTIVDGGSV